MGSSVKVQLVQHLSIVNTMNKRSTRQTFQVLVWFVKNTRDQNGQHSRTKGIKSTVHEIKRNLN